MGGSRTNVRARREMHGISGVHISQGISEGYVAYPSLILRGEFGLMCGVSWVVDFARVCFPYLRYDCMLAICAALELAVSHLYYQE